MSGRKSSKAQTRPVPVVGIGASAGGIGALRRFLPAVTPACGIAFVVVQHLDPERGSMLPEVLQHASQLPVISVTDDLLVEPDHVYVIPPDAELSLEDDHLRLRKPVRHRGLRASIDGFLLSLAEVKGEDCACVILSGTGSDGTIGLRAVKEHGGLTIAQAEAEYDGMMRSAVATGMVDYVLPAEAIPKKLCDYFQHLRAVADRRPPLEEHPDAAAQLKQICAMVRARTGHDFSGYKDKTITRRVQRRMQVLQIDDIGAFVERLRTDPPELEALLRDLLIGVTSFFRDPEAFAALETLVVPKLFEGKGLDDSIRVWVPGCSTGEEAYSIAMLLREQASKLSNPPKLQLFASDIDDRAIRVARDGRFPAAALAGVPERLIERYFVREDGTCRVVGELREMCLFSSHNVLRDAPFSRLDLVSCRNLLIYLDSDLQSRLIPLFHYALNDSGYLFLGNSENVTRHSRLFATVDKAQRIFQRRGHGERRLPDFPLTAPAGSRARGPEVQRPGARQEPVQAMAERVMLDHYAPAYVVVNAEGEVLHASARTGKYLELAPGVPRMDVFAMARRGLRLDLRALLHRAVSTGRVAVHGGIAVGTNGGRQTIDLFVQPLRARQAQDPAYLIVFRDVGGLKMESEPEPDETADDARSAGLRQLESELHSTRERLQSTTEELESSNEELKSANEELSSMNEELQSANEELETSKEELQSMNEELHTVNAELTARVEELSRANSDIANLLESTQIATVFLDRELTVKSFTPAAKDLFRLVESDTGRPIGHVRARFSADTLQEDAERVLRTLATVERQVESTYDGARYVMRVLPYRTVDNVIGGVVVTFVDVTAITEAEARISQLTHDLRERLDNLETLLELLPVGVLFVEGAGAGLMQVNRAGAVLLGQPAEGSGLRPVAAQWRLVVGGRPIPPHELPLQIAAVSGTATASLEGRLERADGSHREVMISAAPLLDETGALRGAVAAVVDISARKASEAHQEMLLHELQHRVKNVVSTVVALASRMARNTSSLGAFMPAFTGRLKAIAGVHELLSQGDWTGVRLRPLIETTLRPLIGASPGRLALDGPEIILTPKAGSALGMVLYELGTNAAKYGALSNQVGRIELSWRVDAAADRLRIDWVEREGPPVTAPEHNGFGMTFVPRCLDYELRGGAEMELRADGLRCSMQMPLGINLQAAGRIDPEEAADDAWTG